MLRPALFSLVATALIPALALQVPLGSSRRWRDEHLLAIVGDEDLAKWSVNKPPNPNATDHLVFETVHSLLQHWPNTRMTNGHNIVPGNIPKGTLLYRGASLKELPSGPEWVSTDPEQAYLFCREASKDFKQGCWHLTLAATRPLKVVYFDGGSAVELPYGSMDTQDLLLWGKSYHGSESVDTQRIDDLCHWGEKFGVDGFVRMEMDFEVMLCDFTSGVSVVSFANIVSQGSVNPTMLAAGAFEAMNAGSWHNRFPGETRVQLDLAGLISFYDTQLAPSLVGIRAGQERWDHRVENIASEDLSAAKSRLEATLTKPEVSSGIDWKTLVQVIVDRYAERLELTRYLLNSPATTLEEILDLTNKTQSQLRIMLTPYLLFSARPTDVSDKADLDWTIPIYKLCATTHTDFLKSQSDSMTNSERLLLQAVQGTSREICRVVTKMWVAGVCAGMDPMLNTQESPDIAEAAQLRSAWAEHLNGLMAWLDWSVWVKCDPSCDIEEMCYLPMWPVGFPGPKPSHPPESDDWMRPQPRCVRRVPPYSDYWPAD